MRRTADSEGSSSGGALAIYSPAQVAVASALGSPFAGALLLARNEWALGRKGRALWTGCGGFAGTGALVGIGALLPAAAAQGLGVGSIVAMHRLAVMTRDARGGRDSERPGSWWIAVALGAACFVLIVSVAVLLAVAEGWVPKG